MEVEWGRGYQTQFESWARIENGVAEREGRAVYSPMMWGSPEIRLFEKIKKDFAIETPAWIVTLTFISMYFV